MVIVVNMEVIAFGRKIIRERHCVSLAVVEHASIVNTQLKADGGRKT